LVIVSGGFRLVSGGFRLVSGGFRLVSGFIFPCNSPLVSGEEPDHGKTNQALSTHPRRAPEGKHQNR
jgi:hypothetical protein